MCLVNGKGRFLSFDPPYSSEIWGASYVRLKLFLETSPGDHPHAKWLRSDYECGQGQYHVCHLIGSPLFSARQHVCYSARYMLSPVRLCVCLSHGVDQSKTVEVRIMQL